MARLLKICLACSLDVCEVVLCLIFLEGLLYCAEVLFDNHETFVDELRGVDCRTVLVVDPDFVVCIDECAEH